MSGLIDSTLAVPDGFQDDASWVGDDEEDFFPVDEEADEDDTDSERENAADGELMRRDEDEMGNGTLGENGFRIPKLDLSGKFSLSEERQVGMEDLILSTSRNLSSFERSGIDRHERDTDAYTKVLLDFADRVADILEPKVDLAASIREKGEHDRELEEAKTRFRDALDQYKLRIHEMTEQLRRNDAQMDYLRGQVARRDLRLRQQRASFLKELSILREQVLQAGHLGEEFRPEWMTFMDWDGPTEDLDAGAGGPSSGGGTVSEKEFQSMRDKYEKEISTLRQKQKEELESMMASLSEAQEELAELQKMHQSKIIQLTKDFEKQKAEFDEKHSEALLQLQEELQDTTDRLEQEKEDAVESLRDQYEDQLSELRIELEDFKESRELMEREHAEAISRLENEKEEIHSKMEEKMESALADVEGRYKQRIVEAEFELTTLRERTQDSEVHLQRFRMVNDDLREQLRRSKMKEGGDLEVLREKDKEIARLQAEVKRLEEELRSRPTVVEEKKEEEEENIDDLKAGMQKDEEIAKDIAKENWGIMKAAVKYKIPKSTKPKGDGLDDLDVFSRLAERYRLTLERIQAKKKELMDERQTNLEQVLATARLLVNPDSVSRPFPHLLLYPERVNPTPFPPAGGKTAMPAAPSPRKRPHESPYTEVQSTAPYFVGRRSSIRTTTHAQMDMMSSSVGDGRGMMLAREGSQRTMGDSLMSTVDSPDEYQEYHTTEETTSMGDDGSGPQKKTGKVVMHVNIAKGTTKRTVVAPAPPIEPPPMRMAPPPVTDSTPYPMSARGDASAHGKGVAALHRVSMSQLRTDDWGRHGGRRVGTPQSQLDMDTLASSSPTIGAWTGGEFDIPPYPEDSWDRGDGGNGDGSGRGRGGSGRGGGGYIAAPPSATSPYPRPPSLVRSATFSRASQGRRPSTSASTMHPPLMDKNGVGRKRRPSSGERARHRKSVDATSMGSRGLQRRNLPARQGLRAEKSVSRLDFSTLSPAERRQAILDVIYRGKEKTSFHLPDAVPHTAR
eukprot:TRINITY_DN15150_c0_g1_i1.p1 TRINITY_DN15150_c0_g1~~TRINITY_DN15150_c0_g1_i1.p1  ORF type:complete len:1018 (-),score=367.35 TRINITY_DN15150_c0_g1_i1:150-3203(-)